MFSSQIGSPTGRPAFRTTPRTPFHFRRRSGPLFSPSSPRLPSSASSVSSTTRTSSLFTPVPNTPPFLPINHRSSSSNSASFSNAVSSNILRWDQDGQLHTIEDFIIKYGGSKSSPPANWVNADEYLRIDAADNKPYNIFSFIDEYGGSLANPPQQWLNSVDDVRNVNVTLSPGFQLPYGPDFKPPTSLFRMSPPKLKYPTGSIDENINAHFVRSALGYLRSSTFVRDVIDWDPRPHPLYYNEPGSPLSSFR